MQRFEGKAAVITGATAGIGLATSRLLSEEGASLTLVARREEAGNALAAELGSRAQFVRADVTDPTAPYSIVERALERSGTLDILINNAGLDHSGPLLETDDSVAEQVFETNFFGAMRMLIAAAQAMRVHGRGSIVNVTSRLASIGVPTMALYGASKGALASLTRGAAVELADAGIRVNAVAPGLTETPLVSEWLARQPDPAAAEAEGKAAIPQGRLGTPEDVAAAIAFLASDDADHITGATLPVDGGYTAA